MRKDFETILDESLSCLKQKESIEACLERHPQYADQLEPLLRTTLKVEVLKGTEPPSAQAMAAGRERFLQEAARLRGERIRVRKPTRGKWILPCAAAALIIALLLTLASLFVCMVVVIITMLPLTVTPTSTYTPVPTDTPVLTMTPMPPTETLKPTDTPSPDDDIDGDVNDGQDDDSDRNARTNRDSGADRHTCANYDNRATDRHAIPR